MSTPRTRGAYLACYALFDRAISTPGGLRVKLPSHDEATNLRMRMHAARAVDRETNARIYPATHHMHASSIYDPFQITLRMDGDFCWLNIVPRVVSILAIEPIPTDPEAIEWTLSETDTPDLIPAPRAALEPPRNTGSPSGTKPSQTNSDFTSELPIDEPSSPNSTEPDSKPATSGLRRL